MMTGISCDLKMTGTNDFDDLHKDEYTRLSNKHQWRGWSGEINKVATVGTQVEVCWCIKFTLIL